MLNGLLVQEPQIERPEHEDNSDVHYQPLPKPVPEEQDVHADHDDYQCEHVKHNGYLISHPSFLLRAAEYRPPFLSSLEKRGPTLKIRTIFSGGYRVHRARRILAPGGGHRASRSTGRCGAAAAPSLRWTRYNARVNRLDAIRLLKALVTAGAKPRAPIDRAWIDEIAVRDVSLHGTELASALAYAEGERWLADSPARKDWIYLTRTGEIVAKRSVI